MSMTRPRAILIEVIDPNTTPIAAKRNLDELSSLTDTFGGLVVVKVLQKRATPDYNTYIGSGKIEELIGLAKEQKIGVLIVNNLLKPKQLFEIEERFRKAGYPLKVWDRVDLILKIFDKHAKTAEAKLQIKLAAIEHMGPRIYGMGLEMMQQAGGIGGRGGQGESNTEMMKRHLAQQVEQTKKELKRIGATHELHRARRKRQGLKTISVVGYTNAGKSTLVNALTKKGAYVANALFATLDTQVGKTWLMDPAHPEKAPTEILVSDTIGFIQHLPPTLIEAFRSTLDEAIHADILLHVIDLNDRHREEKIKEVESVLAQLGVEHTPKIYVFNKCDQTQKLAITTLKKRYKAFTPVFVSAKTGFQMEAVKETIRLLLEHA